MPSAEEMMTPVDPATVPCRRLASGARMPAIGLGTFGSDHVTPEMVSAAVRGAVMAGYRHIDCAAVYGNEAEIGSILREMISEGKVRRDELWITSKLWNNRHGEGEVTAACEASLRDLKLDCLDMYLVHWPFPNYHAPGCDGRSRNKEAKPYIHEAYLRTWREMESLVTTGKVRHIGTSNMSIAKLNLLLADATIPPAVNELECHPHLQQPELVDYLLARGIQPVGFCPIGSPGRPERDRTADDTVDTDDPVIRRIASTHGIHPASLCVKWSAQRGLTPIPFSTNPKNYLANLKSVVSPPLSSEEMKAIAGIDRRCRLIKGQVFLWRENQTWQDLWDEDGTIAT